MRQGIALGMIIVAVLLFALTAGPAPALAAQPPLVYASETPALPGTGVLAGIGAFVGTVTYAPFKAVLICPETALAAGASLAIGGHATAERLVRIGCTGSYLVTPEMIRGRKEFTAGGGPIVEPPPLRLLPLASR